MCEEPDEEPFDALECESLDEELDEELEADSDFPADEAALSGFFAAEESFSDFFGADPLSDLVSLESAFSLLSALADSSAFVATPPLTSPTLVTGVGSLTFGTLTFDS
ncbi:hypothetical protein, partial [Mycobacteroides chelonae]|uniref:hypothetical protein n=1 Tax=Mycobacteroides chelonae TaxID=1774 RepID=UPI0022A84BA5